MCKKIRPIGLNPIPNFLTFPKHVKNVRNKQVFVHTHRKNYQRKQNQMWGNIGNEKHERHPIVLNKNISNKHKEFTNTF